MKIIEGILGLFFIIASVSFFYFALFIVNNEGLFPIACCLGVSFLSLLLAITLFEIAFDDFII